MTNYKLNIEYPNPTVQRVFQKKLESERIDSFQTIKYIADCGLYRVEWDSCLSDITEVSTRYKNVLFTLSGVDEEEFNIWKAWIRNGHCNKSAAKVTFLEPDYKKELPLIEA